MTQPSASPQSGGCDFAADPNLAADQARAIWLPRHNPRLLILQTASAAFADI